MTFKAAEDLLDWEQDDTSRVSRAVGVIYTYTVTPDDGRRWTLTVEDSYFPHVYETSSHDTARRARARARAIERDRRS